MLYTLIGNGNHNKREILASLDTLAAAAQEQDGEFWMMLVDRPDHSDTVRAIIDWLDRQSLYYEVVTDLPGGESVYGEYAHAGTIHSSRRAVPRALSITPARAAVDEQYAVLILSDNLDSDEQCLYAVAQCVDNQIPVFDLSGQMTPLTVEVEAPPGEESPVETPPPALDLTRNDLEALTRDELKSLVVSRGLKDAVTDMRSRDAMIDVLLGSPAPVESAPEPVALEESPRPREGNYFLITMRSSDDYSMLPLTSEQVQRILA